MSFKTRFRAVQPWLSLAVRVAMAIILIVAAIPKLLDLPQSVIAVRAYRILPEAVVPLVGYMLPIVELVLAAVLLAGLFTRLASIVWLLMMAGFLSGVLWAWSQGYQIDCGCFGGGGELDEGESANYPIHVLERLGFIAMGAYLAYFPRSPFSVDDWMTVKT